MQDTECLNNLNVSLKFIEYLINKIYSITMNLFTRWLRVSLFNDSIKFWVIDPYHSNNIDFLQLQLLTKNNYFLFPTQRKYLMVILRYMCWGRTFFPSVNGYCSRNSLIKIIINVTIWYIFWNSFPPRNRMSVKRYVVSTPPL